MYWTIVISNPAPWCLNRIFISILRYAWVQFASENSEKQEKEKRLRMHHNSFYYTILEGFWTTVFHASEFLEADSIVKNLRDGRSK